MRVINQYSFLTLVHRLIIKLTNIFIYIKINFILDIILSVSVTTVPINYLYICKLFASNCVYAWRHF